MSTVRKAHREGPVVSDKKQPGESWESFAERRIRQAQAEGAFAQLPGFGRPIPGIDDPYDENWWIKQKLRDEGLSLVPPALELRVERERTLESLDGLADESDVRRRLETLNERIRQAQLSPVAGPADGVMGVDVDAEIARWRARRA